MSLEVWDFLSCLRTKEFYHWHSSTACLKFFTVRGYWRGSGDPQNSFREYCTCPYKEKFWVLTYSLLHDTWKSYWQIWGVSLGNLPLSAIHIYLLLYIFINKETSISDKPFPPVSLINIAYIASTPHIIVEYWRNAKRRRQRSGNIGVSFNTENSMSWFWHKAIRWNMTVMYCRVSVTLKYGSEAHKISNRIPNIIPTILLVY